MKRGLRISAFSALAITGILLITWFYIMRRQVPLHARCIPKNAIAVLTLNLRELAADRSSDNHLFPEMADARIIHKELESFSKAVEQNDGLGLNATADVLGFFYSEGDAAFFGIAAAVEDSAKFGKLIREYISKQFSISPFTLNGSTLIRFDTTAAVLGYKNDVVLFLYPFGNQSVSETADQCAKLLAETDDESVLSDENFKAHELLSFDAGLWIQPEKFLEFTGGGKLFKTVFENIKYISLAMDFQDGELIIRRNITDEKEFHSSGLNTQAKLSCDPKDVLGFYHGFLNLENNDLLLSGIYSPPLNKLMFDEDRMIALSKTLDGNFTLLLHDTFSYKMNGTSFLYDTDFTRIPINESKTKTERGWSLSFQLKNRIEAQRLMDLWMKEDSIPNNRNTWSFTDQGAPRYYILSDDMLTVTNWKQTDGKTRDLPESWEGLDLILPLDKIIVPDYADNFSFLFADKHLAKQLLSGNLENILISQSVQTGKSSSSQVRITLHNRKINALVQFEELFRKIIETEK
ncbi:hypothetical protein BH09BAC5_BH09BAC5_25950 [soil metagenome]